MSQQEINELIEKELGEWSREVLQRLAAEIERKKLVLTQDLLRSLQAEVLKASASGVAAMRLSFQQSGRISDMKAFRYKGMPPVSAMETFVREVGLENFKYLPYSPMGKVPTESQLINRLAWGIAISKRGKNIAKPKKWFAKPFYGMIGGLIEGLTTVYGRSAAESITDPLNNKK